MTERSPASGRARDPGGSRSITEPVTSTEPAGHRGGGPAGRESGPTDRATVVRRRARTVLAELLAFEALVDDGLAPDARGLERLTTCALDLHLDVQALAAGPSPHPLTEVLGASRALTAAIETSGRILLRHAGR